MTSAALQRSPERRADEINATIRSTVRGLRSARGAEVPDIAAYLGISKGALYGKLKGTAKFLGSELALIALYFGVPVSDFYEGIVRVSPTAASGDTGVETGRYPTPSGRVAEVLSLVRDSTRSNRRVSAGNGSSRPATSQPKDRAVLSSSGMVNHADAA